MRRNSYFCTRPFVLWRRILLWGIYFWMRQRAGILLYGAIRYPKVTYFGHAYLVVGGETKVCMSLFVLFQYVARLGGSQLTHRPLRQEEAVQRATKTQIVTRRFASA